MAIHLDTKPPFVPSFAFVRTERSDVLIVRLRRIAMGNIAEEDLVEVQAIAAELGEELARAKSTEPTEYSVIGFQSALRSFTELRWFIETNLAVSGHTLRDLRKLDGTFQDELGVDLELFEALVSRGN